MIEKKLIIGLIILSTISLIADKKKNQRIYRIEMGEQTIGFEEHTSIYADDNVDTIILTTLHFKRADTAHTIKQKTTIRESRKGVPVYFNFSTSSLGNPPRKIIEKKTSTKTPGKFIQGDIDKNILRISRPLGKTIQKTNILVEPHFYMDYGIMNYISQCLAQKKKKFNYSYYSPELNRIILVSNTVKEMKDDIYSIEARHNLSSPVTVIEKRRASGELIEQVIPSLRIRKTLIQPGTQYSSESIVADIHDFSFVSGYKQSWVNFHILSSINYRIYFENNIYPQFPEDRRQKIVSRGKRIIDINILNNVKDSTKTDIQTPTVMREYLEDNPYLDIYNPQITRMAQKTRKNHRYPYKHAKCLAQLVHQHIKNKNLTAGFESAPVILKKKSGDCSEHAVLFISLARSIGIPARLSFGFVADRGLFRKHFWAEIFIGEWIPVDPSCADGRVDLKYITLGHSSLNNLSLADLGLLLANRLGTIERIEIITLEDKTKNETTNH